MQTYVIPVGCHETSRKVQEALFSAGFKWWDGRGVCHLRDAFLVLHCNNDMCLAGGSGSAYHSSMVRDGNAILISAQDVIANPFALDGAKKAVKKMTVEELEVALGHPVEVVKG